MRNIMPWLINAAQLDKFRKSQTNIVIIDASFHNDERDAKQEFTEKHIIGASFFNIDAFSDPHSPFPHTLSQDTVLIGEQLGKIGIRNDCKIIFYDNSELHTSARALWMLKVFGHNPHLLYILDGGLKAWEKYGGKTEPGEPVVSTKTYTANLQVQFIRHLSDIKKYLIESNEQIADLRHAVRYAGGPETRPGLRRGHIPGSIGLPFYVLFDKEGYFLPLEKIRRKFADVGLISTVPVITSCGSGITAPILNFLLDLIECGNAVYDNSWTEYGAEQLYLGETSLLERPIETCVDY
jgi:thiosulfate/3-mercaptopyruvate sulfurtransferase